MKINDYVRFKDPETDFESTAIYQITNYNTATGRVLITHVNGDFPIPATELVQSSDLEVIC